MIDNTHKWKFMENVKQCGYEIEVMLYFINCCRYSSQVQKTLLSNKDLQDKHPFTKDWCNSIFQLKIKQIFLAPFDLIGGMNSSELFLNHRGFSAQSARAFE